MTSDSKSLLGRNAGPGDGIGAPGRYAGAAETGHVTVVDAWMLGLFTLAGSFWAMQTGRFASVWVVLFYAVCGVASIVWGRVVLDGIHWTRRAGRSGVFVFLVGCLWIHFALAVLKILTPFRIEHLFWLFAALGVWLYWRRREAIEAWPADREDERVGLAAFFLMLVATALWNQHLSPIFIDRGDVYQFDFFNENFSNACNTMPLTVSGFPARGGSFQFAGESLSFYHWGSYTFTALARPMAGIPILWGQAAVWYPMGQFLLGLAVYALGAYWFRPMLGFWAAAATMIVPDPTYWASDVSCLSFLRVFEASSNMLYSEAAAAAAIVLTTAGARWDSGRCIAAGIFAALSAAYFKVNVILMLWPMVLFVLWAAAPRPLSWKVKLAAATFVAIVASAYAAGMRVRSAPTFAPDPHFGRAYINWVSEHSAADSWIAQRMKIEKPHDRVWDMAPRAGWIVLATLQWWLLPWLACVLARLRRPWGDGHVAYVPFLTVLLYGFWAVALAPNENGDPFELQHRSMGWPYLLVVAWTVGEVGTVLGRLLSGLRGDPLLVGYALLAIPLTAGRDYRVPHPEQLLEKGYFDCLMYAREQTDPDDWFVDSRKDPWLITVGMAERRTFMCFARPYYNFPGHGSLAKVHEERGKEIERLLSLRTVDEIRAWGERHGVRWCILHPDTPTRWPREVLEGARFQSGEHRLIDLRVPDDGIPWSPLRELSERRLPLDRPVELWMSGGWFD